MCTNKIIWIQEYKKLSNEASKLENLKAHINIRNEVIK